MDRHQTSKKILEEKLRFAQRASVLVKTPQCKELFRLMHITQILIICHR